MEREKLAAAVSDDGVVELKWEKEAETVVELEQAASADFSDPVPRYVGTDEGSVISGLPEGKHFFRLRAKGGEWSEPLGVEVAFFPRGRLFLLLGIGGVVVLATVGAILGGALSVKSRGEAG
ncbi:MAG: hypothetical protein ACQKBY_12480 [Verrucomicrobiales bacterium]